MMASQTLMSLSRPTEAAVRQIGFTGAAHEGMVTHIGLATLLLRPLHSQILGYAHRFCTRSSHAHNSQTFLSLSLVSQTSLTQPQDTLMLLVMYIHKLCCHVLRPHTLLFTNTGLANAPLTNGGLANALSRTRVTQTVPSRTLDSQMQLSQRWTH